jgi:hypothetical protein
MNEKTYKEIDRVISPKVKDVKEKEEKTEEIRVTKEMQLSPIEPDLIEIGTQQTELDKAFEQLFSHENLKKKTDLKRNEINKITILYGYAKKFGFKELETLIEVFLELMISQGREGRKELVNIAQAQRVRDLEIANVYSEMDKKQKKDRG